MTDGLDPERPVQVPMTFQVMTTQVALPPDGRPAQLTVPADITDFEALALIGAVLQFTDQLRAQRQNSGIVLAKNLPPPPIARG